MSADGIPKKEQTASIRKKDFSLKADLRSNMVRNVSVNFPTIVGSFLGFALACSLMLGILTIELDATSIKFWLAYSSYLTLVAAIAYTHLASSQVRETIGKDLPDQPQETVEQSISDYDSNETAAARIESSQMPIDEYFSHLPGPDALIEEESKALTCLPDNLEQNLAVFHAVKPDRN